MPHAYKPDDKPLITGKGVEIAPHPANTCPHPEHRRVRKLDPDSGEPLEIIHDQLAIYYQNRLVAYCGISTAQKILPLCKLATAEKKAITAEVAKQLKTKAAAVHWAPDGHLIARPAE